MFGVPTRAPFLLQCTYYCTVLSSAEYNLLDKVSEHKAQKVIHNVNSEPANCIAALPSTRWGGGEYTLYGRIRSTIVVQENKRSSLHARILVPVGLLLLLLLLLLEGDLELHQPPALAPLLPLLLLSLPLALFRVLLAGVLLDRG